MTICVPTLQLPNNHFRPLYLQNTGILSGLDGPVTCGTARTVNLFQNTYLCTYLCTYLLYQTTIFISNSQKNRKINIFPPLL